MRTTARVGDGYANFDVAIVGRPGAYAVQVLASPAGQASAPFVHPFSSTEVARFINAVGPPRVTSRRLVPLEGRVTEVRAYGQRLADALFSGDVGTAFRESLAACMVDGSELRIRLRLEAVPDLDALPWEYLYDSRLERFLTLSKKTPVVRVLPSADPPPPVTVTPPLRVLVMISSPAGLARLDVEREERLLRLTTEDLVESGLLELVVLREATLANLQRALLQDVHVFHFIGHGGFDGGTQEGVLALEREGEDVADLVTGARLGTLLHDASSLQLAVLNACEGARTSSRDAFSGVAQALVRQGLPAVVAMQSEISDRAALDFSHQFYWFLSQGLGIEATLCEVRKAMAVSDEAAEWGTPVLLRSETGQPFSVSRQATTGPDAGGWSTAEPVLAAPAADNRVPSLYEAALAALAVGRRDIARPLLEQVAVEQPHFRDVQALLTTLEDPAPGPAGGPAAEPLPPSTAPDTPAPALGPPRMTLWSRVRKALLAIGTPRPSKARRRGAMGCLISVAVVAVVMVAAVVWWWIRIGPYSDTCGQSITSSGDVAQPVTIPCALEVPHIDGQFDEWSTGASHPIPVSSNQVVASFPHGSWKARWDNAGLYVYARLADPTPVVDVVTDTAAYRFVDGITVLFGHDAQRLQDADEARPSDVGVTMAAVSDGVSSVRATVAEPSAVTAAPEVLAQVGRQGDGYEVEARIPWKTLGLDKTPAANSVVALCLLATDGVGDPASAHTVSGCPNWSAGDESHPGAWQTTILSLDE